MSDDVTLNDVLKQCVIAAGGSKVVGPKLWPEKTLDQAQRTLLDCLNEERPHRLSPEQVLLVASLARETGCHLYMQHCAERLHYQAPVPHEPAQQLVEMQRQFAQLVAHQQVLLGQISTLMGQMPPGAVGGLKAVA